ncbi:MAG: penicillin acylase family protein [Pseudomonadota bacterium]
MNTLKRTLLLTALLASLGACSRSEGVNGGGAGSCGGTPASELALKAETALPPGQSGLFNAVGQALGLVTGNPGDYGAHVDDQRAMYWNFQSKPGVLGTKPGTAEVPKAGVEIYRDSYGVPIIYAPNVRDLWFGVGYAIAHDRLFLMDAVRRMGRGTFAELTGCGGVAGDIATRTTTYTEEEYLAIFNGLSQDAKDAVQGYVDGANALRTKALTDPTILPAEYALLTSIPEPFSVTDVLAAGVYITRFVASEGGNEFLNIKMLQQLQAEYGSASAAKQAFQDMVWLEDPKAVATIPASTAKFSNQNAASSGTRETVFNNMADWAMALPDTVWKGDGTGHAAMPSPCAELGTITGAVSLDRGASEVISKPAMQVKKATAQAAKALRKAAAAQKVVKDVVKALIDLRAHLHGGSMAYAIGSSRTRDGGTLMVSGPQLGYSYPLLLVEYEIHSGDYHARGSSVPGLPVVGIGYNNDIAWGLTTGYSKTIDSFIETICSTAQQSAGTCEADQYFHKGVWKDMSCRSETVNFRVSASGIPAAPPLFNTTKKICRTVHGPVVARDDVRGLARSLQFAMWQREIDTIEGIREWNKAKSFKDFVEGTRKLTWNENVTVATRDGHIAYYHPGLFPRRSGDTDMRLPSPGTGEYDFGSNLSFKELPHVVDPPEGYVANWNTKPAFGWLDGEGLGNTSRPGGAGQRVTSILDKLATRSDWSFDDLKEIDRHHGIHDHRAREYLPLLKAFRSANAATLSDVQKAALDTMLAWNGDAFGPDYDITNESVKDGPGATIFGVFVDSAREELFATLKDNVIDSGVPDPDPNNPNAEAGLTVFGRVSGVGSHVFDQSVMDNLILRILKPSTSGLAVRRDYTGGRSRDVILRAALDRTLQTLSKQYNGNVAMTAADLPKSTRIHPRSKLCSLSGVIGPGSDTIPGTSCVTMPYEDRGSWVHHAGYEKP